MRIKNITEVPLSTGERVEIIEYETDPALPRQIHVVVWADGMQIDRLAARWVPPVSSAAS